MDSYATFTLELDKFDLVCLIRGIDVPYDMMDHPIIKRMGRYCGSYDVFDWDQHHTIMLKFTEAQIISAYLDYKNYVTKTAKQTISVQPMTAPIGEIFKMTIVTSDVPERGRGIIEAYNQGNTTEFEDY